MTEQGSSVASPVGNAKGPALTWSERAGPNSGAIRNAAPLGCLNARDERMVDEPTTPATSRSLALKATRKTDCSPPPENERRTRPSPPVRM